MTGGVRLGAHQCSRGWRNARLVARSLPAAGATWYHAHVVTFCHRVSGPSSHSMCARRPDRASGDFPRIPSPGSSIARQVIMTASFRAGGLGRGPSRNLRNFYGWTITARLCQAAEGELTGGAQCHGCRTARAGLVAAGAYPS
jgi:hypothetical protein